MTAARADLDAVDDEHTGSVCRRLGRAPAVAVIGEDHEPETRPSRSSRHVVDRARAVGAVGVHVERARDRAAARLPRRRRRIRRRRRHRGDAGDDEGRSRNPLPSSGTGHR
jgi:hypothetical protein